MVGHSGLQSYGSTEMLAKLLFFAGCALFPLYLFPTGGIQIAHALLAGAIAFTFLSWDSRFPTEALILMMLAGVALLREASAVLAGEPLSVLLQAAYVLYNVFLLVAVQTVYLRSRSVSVFMTGIAAATALALVSITMSGVDLTGDQVQNRNVATFQNPNQFAYFTTVVFSCAVLFFTFGKISKRFTIIIIAATIMMAIASLSKAGMVGMILGLFFFSIDDPHRRLLAVVAVLAFMGLLWVGYVDLDRLLVARRLQDIGAASDDGFRHRGYFVLPDHATNAFHVWFGLGKQGVEEALHREVHSTYLAFFGLYGIVGGMLYLWFLVRWVCTLCASMNLSRAAAIFMPPLFYGIAHNGTRASVFYILVALSFCLCAEARQSREDGRANVVPRRRLPVTTAHTSHGRVSWLPDSRRSTP